MSTILPIVIMFAAITGFSCWAAQMGNALSWLARRLRQHAEKRRAASALARRDPWHHHFSDDDDDDEEHRA